MTAREKAIELFRRVYNDAEKLDEQLAGDLVDALIAATQDSEPGYYRDGVNVLRCVTCAERHPCATHAPAPAGALRGARLVGGPAAPYADSALAPSSSSGGPSFTRANEEKLAELHGLEPGSIRYARATDRQEPGA